MGGLGGDGCVGAAPRADSDDDNLTYTDVQTAEPLGALEAANSLCSHFGGSACLFRKPFSCLMKYR